MDESTQDKKSLPPKPGNSRLYARLHYGVIAAVYSVLTIIALVALGSFGALEAHVRNFARRVSLENSCILYTTDTNTQEVIDGTTVRLIEFGVTSACGFVLWSQSSALIVLFVWVVYNIVLLVLARKV